MTQQPLNPLEQLFADAERVQHLLEELQAVRSNGLVVYETKQFRLSLGAGIYEGQPMVELRVEASGQRPLQIPMPNAAFRQLRDAIQKLMPGDNVIGSFPRVLPAN